MPVKLPKILQLVQQFFYQKLFVLHMPCYSMPFEKSSEPNRDNRLTFGGVDK